MPWHYTSGISSRSIPNVIQVNWPAFSHSNIILGISLTHWFLGDLDVIQNEIFNIVLLIFMSWFPYDNALRRMTQDSTDDKSTLVQVMAWCRQATSHYLSQCWPGSVTPYDITRPQRVNCHCILHMPLSIAGQSTIVRHWSFREALSTNDLSLNTKWKVIAKISQEKILIC